MAFEANFRTFFRTFKQNLRNSDFELVTLGTAANQILAQISYLGTKLTQGADWIM